MEIICTDLSKEARVENFCASDISFGAGGHGATFTKSDVFSPTPQICTRVGKDLLSFFVFFRESREKKKKNQDFQDFCLFFSGSLEIFEIFEKS